MNNDRCERCGSKLVLRTRVSGENAGHRYWTCAKYPRCGFTRKYAEQGTGDSWKWSLKDGIFGMKRVKR